MLAARFLDLDTRGVALLGQVPQGLPALGLPDVSREELNDLLPVAMAGFVLASVETSAIGRMFGQKHGHRFDANQELLAIGAANLLAGLGRGFPVSGGMSQSLVNESAGARTPISGLVAAVFTLIVVLFASGLLRNLPQPVLAAIVLAAVMSLVDLRALRHIWRFSRGEFFVAIAALLGVLGSGPVNGVLLGAAMSIVLLLRQGARPRVIELARVPGTTHFADRLRHPENEQIPGVLVIRCESALLYFNVEYVRERVLDILAKRPDGVGLVVFYLGAVPKVDLSGAELLADLHKTFRARAIDFRLADTHGEVRDALRRIGFEQEYGLLETGQTVDVVVTAWQASRAAGASVRPSARTEALIPSGFVPWPSARLWTPTFRVACDISGGPSVSDVDRRGLTILVPSRWPGQCPGRTGRVEHRCRGRRVAAANVVSDDNPCRPCFLWLEVVRVFRG